MAPKKLPTPDDLTTVTGRTGTLYLCPDLPAVDHNISLLYREIAHLPATHRDAERALWADIDLLLDRRKWLEVTSLTATG
ncbi:hypothetical protein VSH64_08080 [Amycolatopsis rhabdoformis]|uniref:Uncharacterized protein n=1 Tax=Amycolatopsis rhabdoformis TaxID=1448059 RepID=A0ABZ1IDC5_9PSEU|nr:hypothetical protein [Amycolatopsis rhabdoformis]WSE32064.1 hypothetical protein VSH64_08080 [Amycolatopsis rhabdoformis]